MRTVCASESGKAHRTEALEGANLIHTGGATPARIIRTLVDICREQAKIIIINYKFFYDIQLNLNIFKSKNYSAYFTACKFLVVHHTRRHRELLYYSRTSVALAATPAGRTAALCGAVVVEAFPVVEALPPLR